MKTSCRNRQTDRAANMTTAPDGGATVMDAEQVYKTIGLYRLLQPAAGGGFGRRSRAAFLAVLRLTAGLLTLQLFRLYASLDDLQTFMYTAMVITIGANCVYKGRVLVTDADRLRAVLDATRPGFTSCGRRHPAALRRCRVTLAGRLRAFAAFGCVTGLTWIVTPLLIVERAPHAGPDGAVGRCRQSIINFWFPVSGAARDRTPVWALVYAVETVVSVAYVASLVWFDTYLITVCTVLSAQFRTVSAAYKTLGRSSRGQSPSRPSDSHIKINHTKVDYYEQLMDYIKDNQKIIKKFDELFDIVRSVILVHITSSTYSLIAFIFLTILTYLANSTIVSSIVIRCFSGFILHTLEIYIFCYLLDHLENAKSSINFGLYSSNWTEMDLKFKKTLLLAMIMNSAHKRVMNISPKFIINLELFTRVMNISYSIVSVLLNSNVKKIAKT